MPVFPQPYVFFDVDDTLIQWTVSWAGVFAQAAGEAGVEVTAQQAAQALARADDGFYEDCVHRHAGRGDLHRFWLDYDGQILALLGVKQDLRRHTERVIELLSQPAAIRPYPEVLAVLAELRAGGAQLGILTGRPQAGPDLERLGLRHYFDQVVDAFTAGSSKAEGRMFRMAAEAAARAGRTGWHVGDSYELDVQGARAAGLRPILLDRRQAHPEADCPRLADLRPLPGIVLLGAAGAQAHFPLTTEASP